MSVKHSPVGRVELAMPGIESGRPEVTMAPLIDVVFLLLIFFMVTTVFPDNRGMEIERPESEYSEPLPLKRLLFTLNHDGALYYQERQITLPDISRLVREQLSAAPDTAVMLLVDKRATTQSLMTLMDACKSAGAFRVGIASIPAPLG